MTAMQFGTILLAVAVAALPYIAAGVAAGAIVFMVVLGLRKGVTAIAVVAEDSGGSTWTDADAREWQRDLADGLSQGWSREQSTSYADKEHDQRLDRQGR